MVELSYWVVAVCLHCAEFISYSNTEQEYSWGAYGECIWLRKHEGNLSVTLRKLLWQSFEIRKKNNMLIMLINRVDVYHCKNNVNPSLVRKGAQMVWHRKSCSIITFSFNQISKQVPQVYFFILLFLYPKEQGHIFNIKPGFIECILAALKHKNNFYCD